MCRLCDTSFADKTSLRMHQHSHHGGERPHRCDFCAKTFAHKTNLTRHIRAHLEAEEQLQWPSQRPYQQVSATSISLISFELRGSATFFTTASRGDEIALARTPSHCCAQTLKPSLRTDICIARNAGRCVRSWICGSRAVEFMLKFG